MGGLRRCELIEFYESPSFIAANTTIKLALAKGGADTKAAGAAFCRRAVLRLDELRGLAGTCQ